MATTKAGACPICGAKRSDAYRPFCSKRCADIDLGKWVSGSYAIPAAEEDDPDAQELAADPSMRPSDRQG
ncbi:MAG: DNA gyrase inhibitor YacG [Neomegalonema sp.]|nr:DNA gyrase inhibitor YacG [Neomegalonema sp.]